MSKESTGVTLALIASFTSLLATGVGLGLSTWKDFQIENKKWISTREDEADRNLRLAIADFARELSTAALRVSWIAWTAENEKDRSVISKELVAYNADMRLLLPKVVAAQTVLASQDKATYDRVANLPTQLRQVDTLVANAVENQLKSAGNDSGEVKRGHQIALDLIKELPDRFASAIAQQTPERTK
jgi:hypothetical protein